MLFINVVATAIILGLFSFCWRVSKDYYFPVTQKIEYKTFKNFKKGDIILHTDPDHDLSLKGMIVDIQNETYLIKWYGFHTALQNQTCLYINKSSKLVCSM